MLTNVTPTSLTIKNQKPNQTKQKLVSAVPGPGLFFPGQRGPFFRGNTPSPTSLRGSLLPGCPPRLSLGSCFQPTWTTRLFCLAQLAHLQPQRKRTTGSTLSTNCSSEPCPALICMQGKIIPNASIGRKWAGNKVPSTEPTSTPPTWQNLGKKQSPQLGF